jgi:hypothetical protein
MYGLLVSGRMQLPLSDSILEHSCRMVSRASRGEVGSMDLYQTTYIIDLRRAQGRLPLEQNKVHYASHDVDN